MTRRAALTTFIVLPALALLVLVVGSLTSQPYLDALVGLIIVVNAVLGAYLCSDRDNTSTPQYDGSLDVVIDHDREETNLNFSMDPEKLFREGATDVRLKVNFPS